MNDHEYPGGWFGPSWGAQVCETARHLPTPVGEQCLHCRIPIVEGDQGLTIPGVHDGAYNLRSIHIDCFLREAGLSAEGKARKKDKTPDVVQPADVADAPDEPTKHELAVKRQGRKVREDKYDKG